MIKYKIIEANPESHSIIVRFYTDTITEHMLSVDTVNGVVLRARTDYSFDLPIPAPTGLELNKFISARAPTAWLEAQENIRNPNIDTSLAVIIPLVGREVEALPFNETLPLIAATFTTDLNGNVANRSNAGTAGNISETITVL
jgi:hypothetical protein